MEWAEVGTVAVAVVGGPLPPRLQTDVSLTLLAAAASPQTRIGMSALVATMRAVGTPVVVAAAGITRCATWSDEAFLPPMRPLRPDRGSAPGKLLRR